MASNMNDFIDRVITALRQGWCQNMLHRYEGHKIVASCLYGAQRVAVDRGGSVFSKAFTDLDKRLNEKVRLQGVRGAVEWNDVPGRTVDEVVALLESCKDKEGTTE